MRPRLLLVSPYLPVAGVHAGGARMLRLLAELRADADWSVLALDGPSLTRRQAQAARAALQDLGVVLTAVPFRGRFQPHLGTSEASAFAALRSPAMREAVARALAGNAVDLVQVEYTPAAAWLPARTAVPVALTVHQLESHAAWRAARQERRPRPRVVHLLDAVKAAAAEASALRRADAVLCLTRREAAFVRGLRPGGPVTLAPLAVDPAPTDLPRPEVDLIFHGDYAHPPNLDAARRLITEILPAVQAHLPGATLRLLGPHAPVGLRELARRRSVQLAGRVPDLPAALSRGRVYVAPLALGGGMRGKLLDALAVGLPVVTTKLGAEGLLPERGGIICAAAAPAQAAAAARLLVDATDRVRRGERARELAAEFTWSKTADAYRRTYLRLLSGTAPR